MLKVVNNFVSDIDIKKITSFISKIDIDLNIDNKHIISVASKLNGVSFMFDISKSEISNKLSMFQSSNNILDIDLPDIFLELVDKISSYLSISSDNVFLQILSQDKGGFIHPHYDSAIDGYITYKCNICIDSEDYKLFIDKESFDISKCDLYCFEASLYKHWTNPFNSKRIILSYGFILPYEELGRCDNDPRVRLSKRIINYFQN